jgi:hypothetical protein
MGKRRVVGCVGSRQEFGVVFPPGWRCRERPICGGDLPFDVLLMPVVAGVGNAYFRQPKEDLYLQTKTATPE